MNMLLDGFVTLMSSFVGTLGFAIFMHAPHKAWLPASAIGGVSYGIRWWLSGIVFDVPHAIGNLVIGLLLFAPMRKLLTKLYS